VLIIEDESVGVVMLSVLFIIVLLSVVIVVELLSVEVVLAPSLLQATNEHAITAIAKNFFI